MIELVSSVCLGSGAEDRFLRAAIQSHGYELYGGGGFARYKDFETSLTWGEMAGDREKSRFC